MMLSMLWALLLEHNQREHSEGAQQQSSGHWRMLRKERVPSIYFTNWEVERTSTLASLSQSCNSQDWAAAKARSWEHNTDLPCERQDSKYLNRHHCFQQFVLAGSWSLEPEPRTKLRHSNMGCRHPDRLSTCYRFPFKQLFLWLD